MARTASGSPRLYVLRDPRDGAIRYAGVTRTSMKDRLCSHMSHARCRPPERRARLQIWIRALAAEGVEPEIQQVGQTTDEGWRAAEQLLIWLLKLEGCDLVNGDKGGAGYDPRLASSTTVERRRATLRARREANPDKPWYSPEGYELQMARLRAQRLTPEQKAHLSEIRKGTRLSPETREKIGQASRGKPQTPEVIAARVAGRRAKGPWFPNVPPLPDCAGCGKQLAKRRSTRCHSCENRRRAAMKREAASA